MTAYDALMWIKLIGILAVSAFLWIVIHILCVKYLKKFLSPSSSIRASKINSQQTRQRNQRANNPDYNQGRFSKSFRNIKIVKSILGTTTYCKNEQKPINNSYWNGYIKNAPNELLNLWRKHIAIMKDTIMEINHILRLKGKDNERIKRKKPKL